jgi:hypothetical protein
MQGLPWQMDGSIVMLLVKHATPSYCQCPALAGFLAIMLLQIACRRQPFPMK